MNNIDRLFCECTDASQFASGYLSYLAELLTQLNTSRIAAFIEELELAREHQNTVFFVGNGGSAATASHMANDFGIGTRTGDDSPPFRALALTDNVAALTAIANDNGYHNLFVFQLRIHYRPGDRLVAISASGDSPNVIAAAEWVKKRGGKVIGLVGFDGGKLQDLCDLIIHVKTPKGEYGPVEDIHMILDHLVYSWLQCQVQKKKDNVQKNNVSCPGSNADGLPDRDRL